MPCIDIFQCDSRLACATPIEMDFYNMSRPFMAAENFQRNPLMCSICADTANENEGVVDADLKTVFVCVLPICATCKSKGAKIVVGRYLPNGKALLKRLDNSRRVGATTASAP